MQKTDQFIRARLRLPFTRPGLVLRPRPDRPALHGLHERICHLNITLISITCGGPTAQDIENEE